MSLNKILIVFFLIIAPFSGLIAGEKNKKDKKFNAGDMIMHHIIDTHEWHILDWKGKHISIPLPIILYHEGVGLVTFMSSKFNHGKSAVFVSDSFIGYNLDHGNIYAVDKSGKINKTETSKIWDLSITKNTLALILSIFVLIVVFFNVSRQYIKNHNSVPTGLRGVLEIIIMFVRDDIARPAIGEKSYKKYLPFLLTVFFFILLNNFMGLVPIFPGGANLTGNIAVPMVLASMVFVITLLSGKKTYWQHIFVMPGVPKPVLLILTPIEIIGVILKPLVLMIRLFANITAGHIIVLSFFSLIFIFGELSPVAGYGASILSVGFVVFMTMLEFLVAFLQAYVFTLLSAIYFGAAVEEEH